MGRAPREGDTMKNSIITLAAAAGIAATAFAFPSSAGEQARRISEPKSKESARNAPASNASQRSGRPPAETQEEAGMPISLVFADGGLDEAPIEIRSVNFSVSNEISGGAGAARRRSAAQLSDIQLTFDAGSHSPSIWESTLAGRVVPNAFIRYRRSVSADARGNAVYMTFALQNVTITSFSHGHAERDQRPIETITLSFEEIETTYTEYDNRGAKRGEFQASWNAQEGR